MGFIIFLKGVLIGFIMAVPLGPIGIMCIRKTLTEGRLRGFVIGFGAATADLLYGSIAAFGLTIISDMIISQLQPLLQVFLWDQLYGFCCLAQELYFSERN